MANTQQGSIITAYVAGQPLGFFDTKSGGDTSGEPTKRRSGGSFALKSYGVMPDYTDVVITRVNENDRDTELNRWLRAVAGKVTGYVQDQPTDATGTAYGKPTIYSGMFYKIEDGDTDVTSGDARMESLTFQINKIQ